MAFKLELICLSNRLLWGVVAFDFGPPGFPDDKSAPPFNSVPEAFRRLPSVLHFCGSFFLGRRSSDSRSCLERQEAQKNGSPYLIESSS